MGRPDLVIRGLLYPADLEAGSSWDTLPPIKGERLAGFKLPNFTYDAVKTPGPSDYNTNYNYSSQWTVLASYISYDATRPFNAWLEYKNKAGTWVPTITLPASMTT